MFILNQKAAQRLFPGRDPIGQMVTINGQLKVVGVVGNVRHQALEEEGGLEIYLPIAQQTMSSVELVVRTNLAPASVAPAIRGALKAVEPNLPTTEYQELGEMVAKAVSPRRFMVLLLGAFAVAALLLASIGIYGVVSYTVARRTQEIGIRMALGASAFAVQRHVMAQTVALVSAGIVGGIAGSLVVARLMASLLYHLEPTDPVSLVATVLVLLAVAVSAAWVPALRASRVDPMSALRTE